MYNLVLLFQRGMFTEPHTSHLGPLLHFMDGRLQVQLPKTLCLLVLKDL
jgi:hypothetical protein